MLRRSDELTAPYVATIGPDGVATLRFEGSEWGKGGPGRPAVSLTAPDGDIVWPGVSLVDGELTVEHAFDRPGR
jgi:hypothetical protein